MFKHRDRNSFNLEKRHDYIIPVPAIHPGEHLAEELRESVKKQVLDQKTLDDIIRRVVEVAQPERIILFGSAARGDMTQNSDVDLLIIKEGGDATVQAN